MLTPDMPTQELRLHMGELTANELRVARAAIGWANSAMLTPEQIERIKKVLDIPINELIFSSGGHRTVIKHENLRAAQELLREILEGNDA